MPITIDLKNDPYFKEGVLLGEKIGEEKGIKKGIKKGILVLMDLGLKKEEIAKKMNLSLEEIEEILKEDDETSKNW